MLFKLYCAAAVPASTKEKNDGRTLVFGGIVPFRIENIEVKIVAGGVFIDFSFGSRVICLGGFGIRQQRAAYQAEADEGREKEFHGGFELGCMKFRLVQSGCQIIRILPGSIWCDLVELGGREEECSIISNEPDTPLPPP